MGYQAATFTDQHDLLDKIKTFCLANGWTQDVYSAGASPSTRGELMMHNARGLYIAMASHYSGDASIYPANGLTTTKSYDWDGIALIGATGYTALNDWQDHPGANTFQRNSLQHWAVSTSRFGDTGGDYWISGDGDGVAVVIRVGTVHWQIAFGHVDGGPASWAGTLNGAYYWATSGIYLESANAQYEHITTGQSSSPPTNEIYNNSGAIYTPAYKYDNFKSDNNSTTFVDQSGWHSAHADEPETDETDGPANFGCWLHGPILQNTGLPSGSNGDMYEILTWYGPSEVTGASPMYEMMVDLHSNSIFTTTSDEDNFLIRTGFLRRLRNISHDAFASGDITTLPGGEEWVVFPCREDADGVGKVGLCLFKE